MIDFYLDDDSGLPPYHQLVRQVRHAMRLGLLREDDRLPAVWVSAARQAGLDGESIQALIAAALRDTGAKGGRSGVTTLVV